MLQEKCCRDITDTLQKTLARSFLQEFASRLDVDLDGANDNLQMTEQAPQAVGSDAQQNQNQNQSNVDNNGANSRLLQGESLAKQKEVVVTSDNINVSPKQVNLQFQTAAGQDRRSDKQKTIDSFKENSHNPMAQSKILKNLTTDTDEDLKNIQRQKNGQLRYGDVIALTYQEDVHIYLEKEAIEQEKQESQFDLLSNNQPKKMNKQNKKRILNPPDFVYSGLLYSDGVTDQGMKVIPIRSNSCQNAANLFKQCLFRIEIEQTSQYNQRGTKLDEQKKDIEKRLRKLITDDKDKKIDNPLLKSLKDELELISKDIEVNKKNKKIQDENNEYEQKYQIGNKLTYGCSIQLKHLFSDKYLTVNLNQMSQEYGCCEMFLNETTKDSIFTIQPSQDITNVDGYVVNFNDFFHIKSQNSLTPFYFHIFKKPNDQEFEKEDKTFKLNASQQPSKLKAKLFMSYDEQSKTKQFIQSGDVVRLKHLEANSYLTTGKIHVDELLPKQPDFMKGQIRRMNLGQNVEWERTLRMNELSEQQLIDIQSDQGYENHDINDDYVKDLKGSIHEEVYIERNQDRLLFANSCWEIQRMDTMAGGNVSLDEVCRFRHIGTGKYLAICNIDESELVLINSSNSLQCLFILKSDMAQKKVNVEKEHMLGHLQSGQRVMIYSYLNEKYLQLMEELQKTELTQFKLDVNHVNDEFLSQEDKSESQLKIINHTYQKKDKLKMIFFIQEIPPEQSIQSYQSSCIFDELLEFYAFLNVWAVDKNDVIGPAQQFYYSPDKAIEDSDALYDRVQKMLFILDNIQQRIISTEHDSEKLNQCKNELQQQGILDLLCRCLDIMYYKTTPPVMFQKPFKNSSNDVDLDSMNIDQYVAQQIARDNLDQILLKTLELILHLVRGHRNNSEQMTKYFNTLYMHTNVQEQYLYLNVKQPEFKVANPKKYIQIISEIFKRAQKNSLVVFNDISSNSLIQYKQSNDATGANLNFLGIDSTTANEQIQNVSSNNVNQVQKWLDLLEPVKFQSTTYQNLDKQINVLNIIAMFCRNQEGTGVYPYQMQVIKHIFKNKDNIPLEFSSNKIKNCLRPFVHFNRPKMTLSVAEFCENNPILTIINDDYNENQKNQNSFEMTWDLHELTKNYSNKGKETWPYVDYICAVVNLYATMCLSANTKAIKLMSEIGLDEATVLLCIHKDSDKLNIHEKLHQSFMFLTRTMFIENDPIAPGIDNKNRCYIWEKLGSKQQNAEKQEEYVPEEQIINDFYAGKARQKLKQMDDPNNSMVVLRYDQDSKDLALIRIIKKQIVSFLQEESKDTQQLFSSNEKTFIPKDFKIKIKSLKVYLDTIYSLVAEDCVDSVFIEDVKLILQCALTGCACFNEEMEKKIPAYITTNWVYKLCWFIKSYCVKNPDDSRSMKQAIKQIESKILDIFDKLQSYKLNLQIQKYLQHFRQFQEQNLDPQVQINLEDDNNNQIEELFDELFKVHQFEIDIKSTTMFLNLKKRSNNGSRNDLDINFDLDEAAKDKKDQSIISNKIPFDMIFMQYIIVNNTNDQIRTKALEILISNFNQRDNLVKQLSRTEIIVSSQDYKDYTNFLSKQRQIQQLTNKLIQDEYFLMVFKEDTGQETKNAKNDIINILNALSEEIQQVEPFKKKRIQNMLRHIGFITHIINVLLKRLIFNETQYKDLFQCCINFIYQSCYENPSCQLKLLPELNFFLDMMNQQIETTLLISEIIKSNKDIKYNQSFARYLINKIVNEGYYKSNLFVQLIKLVDDSNQPDFESQENPNKQFILKQIIKSNTFRSLLFMRKSLTQKKLGIIKQYSIKKQQYNNSNKADDESIDKDKENLNLHLSIVDLLAACAKNNPFGIAQAQRLIECEELLDSILSDAIPFVVKKHYFNLLFEVYLRKVQGLEDTSRLSVNDIKFQQVLKWVVLFDLNNTFHYYNGLINDIQQNDNPALMRQIKQVNLQIQRISEADYQDKNKGKSQQDLEQEMKFKSQLTAFKDTVAYYFIDQQDKTEFWRYLFNVDNVTKQVDGIIYFLEQFYNDYSVKELGEENMADITSKLRESLLAMANKLFSFVDQYGPQMKSYLNDILVQINKTIQKIPHYRAFKMGAKRIIKNGKIVEIQKANKELSDASLNQDESREIDNRVSNDRILNIIKDYVIKEKITIREALKINDITDDLHVNRNTLKDTIKVIVGSQATYDDIIKTLDYIYSSSLQRKQDKQVVVGEPGQRDFIMNRTEQVNIEHEIKFNQINFKDFEYALKYVLKKEGYKAPLQQRERVLDDNLKDQLIGSINENDYSIAINMDFKLFTQRFYEYIHISKNFSEMHDFVQKLMESNFIINYAAKVQLIKNILKGFVGLQGFDDEIILIKIINLIIQRVMPLEEDNQGNLVKIKKLSKQIKNSIKELREWQDVMYEAGVPELMLSFINLELNNTFLSNSAVACLNNLLLKASDKNQEKMLDLLKQNNRFFVIFNYVKVRLNESKIALINSIKMECKQKFIKQNKIDQDENQDNKPNNFEQQNIFINQKYDLEQRYDDLRDVWKNDEMNTLLEFLNLLCEGCFEPAQLFLREQISDTEMNLYSNNGKITSVDLIYTVALIFIDIVDTLGDYVFADYRTFKILPMLMDTLIEFIYGPCLKNQKFLGGWKKLISTINSLINQKEMGNYSGIHQQAKSQLAILYSSSQILLAICDIKDPIEAKQIHSLMIQELDIENLKQKFVDIWTFKIGGSSGKQTIYDYTIMCNHFNKDSQQGQSNCIQDEFCAKGHMIQRDLNTIESGFNIYQILQILYSTNKNHLKMKTFIRSEYDYIYLSKEKKAFMKQILYKNVITYEKTHDIYHRFNETEMKLIDEFIIKQFPKTFIKFIEVNTQNLEQDNVINEQNIIEELNQNVNDAKQSKNQLDQQQILEKVRDKIRNKLKNYQKSQTDKEQCDDHDNDVSGENETKQLIDQDQVDDDGNTIPVHSKFLNRVSSVFMNKVATDDYETEKKKQLQEENDIRKKEEDKVEYIEKLNMFTFYLASNFFEDNIGQIEVQTEENQIINTTFQMPAFVHCLTTQSRELIPTKLNQVSQQEKLESFVASINILVTEMQWQKQIGAYSQMLKKFSNNWLFLSYINFTMIVIINTLFIAFMEVIEINGQNVPQLKDAFQVKLTETLSMFQTILAGIVVISYFIDARARLKFQIQQNRESKMSDIPGYGANKGSQGYGNKKSNKMQVKHVTDNTKYSLKRCSRTSTCGKLIYLVWKELQYFYKACYYDRDHTRNIIYLGVSYYASYNKFWNAFLLIDIINKIETLRQVISIFNENKIALASTLLLFVVALYIFSFYAFQESIRDAFGAADMDTWTPADGPPPPYQMYCDTLVKCLMSTINGGIRSGGGIGDPLDQPLYGDKTYWKRYTMDLLFFMLINIILMNIFFGIIIDSFADKRAKESEIDTEVEDQCFICGLKKSTFEIENVNWQTHIYEEHNLHSYLAFIIYVKKKKSSECTGIEKWVKQNLDEGLITFFPINKCLSIRGGEQIE